MKLIIQVNNSNSVMHIIGAALLFTSGAAYCWTQTFTTFQLTKFKFNEKSVFTARLAISSILTLSTLLFLICGGLGYHDKTPDTVLIVGNLAEWIAAWCFGLFGLTFFKEFQNLSLKVQCIPRCSGQNSDALKYSSIPVSGLDENITDSDWRSSKFKGAYLMESWQQQHTQRERDRERDQQSHVN